ncbi:transporter substrate-binding domain-containing protein [Oleiharenicola lentus]|uniref:histidine kinase n=1 Tax=Oleiharenicola lentus TaxID=2508720 RepID=A0A4Q1C5W5_9BACT|nr:transporter substrate-binding domain-containing protein [Oleiharenicola lentus]RXK53852.1 transporter substrate-binding domain-containing protein [Oleiharenicola lentus]
MTTPHRALRQGACLAGLLLALTLRAEPVTAPAANLRPLAARQPLIVGVTTDSYPYGFIDAQGRATGFSTDLLDAVARVMQLEIKRVAMPGRELHDRFREGEFDMLQIYSQTAERDSYSDFTVPFLTLRGAVFIQEKGSPIRRLEDFNGRKFAIIGTRSMGERFIADHGLRVDQVSVSASEEALRLISRGEVAGSFLSQLTALSVIEERRIGNVAMFGEPLAGYDIRHCFAVHKGDALLLARLNEGLSILHRTGEFGEIYQRWFGRIDSPLITRDQAVNYGLILLTLGLAGALTAYLRLRFLHRRIATQADELNRQQILLRALYDNIPLTVCVLEATDSGGHRVLLLNRAAEVLFALPAGTAAGRLLDELPLEPELRAELTGFISRNRAVSSLVRENRHLPRTNRDFSLMLVPLLSGPAEIRRCCLLLEDTTERRRLDEEVAQSRKLRAVGELVGGIAHEFNNLLTPILLKSGEIMLDRPQDRELGKSVGLIASTAQRAAELTRRLLTFGRKNESRPEVVRLSAAIDSCFALLRLTMDRRIRWQNDTPAELPPLYLNATDLNQILVNLILNARDTLLDRLQVPHPDTWIPQIRIDAAAVPAEARPALADVPTPGLTGWVRLVVQDNGMGMPAEVRERIYEPFFTTKSVGQGTGLGLATVWHLVHMCGGHIEVDSVPGEGTSFLIFLPILPAPLPTIPISAPANLHPSGNARVFLAEDDDFVAQTVTAVLKREGHVIHREPDGSTAWQTLETRSEEFDLLVLDVNMPGLSGIDVLRRVRAAGRYRGPVIVMSGRLGSEEMELLTAARVDCIIHKPFEVADLIANLRKVLANRRAG